MPTDALRSRFVRLLPWKFLLWVGVPLGILLFAFAPTLPDSALLPKFTYLALFMALGSLFGLRYLNPSSISAFWRLLFFPLLGAFLLWAGLSLIYVVHPVEGQFTWMSLSLQAVYLLVLVLVFNEEKGYPTQLSLALSLMGLCVSVQAAWQFWESGTWQHWTFRDSYLLTGSFGHKNVVAQVLLICFPFGWYHMACADRRWEKILALGSSLVGGLFLLLLASRSAWLGLIAGAGLVYLLWLGWGPGTNRQKRWGKGLGLFLGLGLILLLWTKGSAIIRLNETSFYERTQLWSKTWSLIQSHPYIGSGLGEWAFEIPTLGASDIRSWTGETYFVRPHNDWLWTLSELGIVGLLLYGGLWVCLGYYLLGLIRTQAPHKLFWFCIAFVWAAYIVMASLSFPRERMAHVVLMPLWASPVLIASLRRSRISSVRVPRWLYLSLLVGLAFWMGLSSWAGYQRWQGTQYLQEALALEEAGHWQAGLRKLQRINPSYFQYDHSKTPLPFYQGTFYVNHFEPRLGCPLCEEAYSLHPHHPRVLTALAYCHKLARRYAQAERYYQQALAISPAYVVAQVSLAGLYHETGRHEEAYALFSTIDPERNTPRYLSYRQLILDAALNRLLSQASTPEKQAPISRLKTDEGMKLQLYRAALAANRSFTAEVLDWLADSQRVSPP